MDTALTGDLNRSGLFDVLTRTRDLALDLIGLTCLASGLASGWRSKAPGYAAPDSVSALRREVLAGAGS